MSVEAAILDHVRLLLQDALIDNLPVDDASRAGVVKIGHLQGDPDPDEARISVTIHRGDPDAIRGMGTATTITDKWNDKVIEIEMGCGTPITTWARRFSVQTRALLENSGENLAQATEIASDIRKRIEHALLGARLTGVREDDEYVSRGIYDLDAETIQSGGPDAYDFLLKVRFEVWTTTGV